MQALVHPFFDPATGTVTYVVEDEPGGACAIIDPVLDYDGRAGRTSTASASEVADYVRERRLQLQWVLETHVHADHLSAAAWLRDQLGGRIGVGREVTQVQKLFGGLFNLGPGFKPDGSQFDHLFSDGEFFSIGRQQGQVVAMPGHTPACVAYRIGDAVFVGDTLFMPDVGTARCDFPGGSAVHLYRSIRRLLELPPATRLFLCHDYPPPGRGPRWETTVAEQRAGNVHVRDGIDEAAFVAMRDARDATLALPALLLPAVQVNIRAGQLPAPEANGIAYLKIPLDAL